MNVLNIYYIDVGCGWVLERVLFVMIWRKDGKLGVLHHEGQRLRAYLRVEIPDDELPKQGRHIRTPGGQGGFSVVSHHLVVDVVHPNCLTSSGTLLERVEEATKRVLVCTRLRGNV